MPGESLKVPKNQSADRRLRARLLPVQRWQYDDTMNLGFSEMIFTFFLALIIFGPKKLPEIGRQIGKALNEFKRASNEFKAQIESEINNIDIETRSHEILPPARAPEGVFAAGGPQVQPVEPNLPPTDPEVNVKAQDA